MTDMTDLTLFSVNLSRVCACAHMYNNRHKSVISVIQLYKSFSLQRLGA